MILALSKSHSDPIRFFYYLQFVNLGHEIHKHLSIFQEYRLDSVHKSYYLELQNQFYVGKVN